MEVFFRSALLFFSSRDKNGLGKTCLNRIYVLLSVSLPLGDTDVNVDDRGT